MKWSIEKTRGGFMVICYTENDGGAFAGRDIHLQARFDTFKEAVLFARERGVKI